MNNFFVIDTNTLISASLVEGSIPAKALDKAIESGAVAISKKTMDEFIEVLFRKRLDKYFLTDEERWVLVNRIETAAVLFTPEFTITECRDPKDDKFLELAVAAKAACIVSGDKDLLILHPFRGIPILNAGHFLNSFQNDLFSFYVTP